MHTCVHKLKQLVSLCVCPCVSCPNFGLSEMKSMTSKQINNKSEFYTLYITVHLSNGKVVNCCIDTHACWAPLVINATIYKFILLVYFLVVLYTSSQCSRACFSSFIALRGGSRKVHRVHVPPHPPTQTVIVFFDYQALSAHSYSTQTQRKCLYSPTYGPNIEACKTQLCYHKAINNLGFNSVWKVSSRYLVNHT